jgi:hypothetical protein
MVSALITSRKRRWMMIVSYNNDPNQFNWIKLFGNLFWLLIFLSVLAGVVKIATEQ